MAPDRSGWWEARDTSRPPAEEPVSASTTTRSRPTRPERTRGAVELRESVHEGPDLGGGGMIDLVVPGVVLGRPEAEVRAQVDEEARLGRVRGEAGHRRPVGEGEEERVCGAQLVGRGEREGDRER